MNIFDAPDPQGLIDLSYDDTPDFDTAITGVRASGAVNMGNMAGVADMLEALEWDAHASDVREMSAVEWFTYLANRTWPENVIRKSA